MTENNNIFNKNDYSEEQVSERLKTLAKVKGNTSRTICLSYYASFLKSNFDSCTDFAKEISKVLDVPESLITSRVMQGKRLSNLNCITAYELMTNPKYNLVVNGGGK